MKGMHVCNYSVARFLPYPETQEFVNIGVVLVCPDLRLFGFRIETRRRDRVTGFFPELDPDVFIRGRHDFGQEVLRVKRLLMPEESGRQMQFSFSHEEFLQVFREIVRPRESLFRFGEIGTVLTENPVAELDRIYGQCVERQFAQHEDYQENVMAKRLAKTFRATDILGFEEQRLGDDLYHVTIPLVRRLGDELTAVRAIKPLDLAKREPTRIIEHGDRWLARIEHLRRMQYDPAAFLFPVQMPPCEQRKTRAAEQVCELLDAAGVRVVPAGETERIVDFAASA
jgi:hypothetical protein